MKLYVEGGGESKALKTACRAGFSEFLSKAGLKGKMPRIVACGSREDAFDSFCTAINQGDCACLLVDSEDAVATKHQQGKPEQWQPWEHLKQCDNWEKPESATDLECHLMVQCMEAWFMADCKATAIFFARGFEENRLPAAARPIESISKQELYDALKNATQNCQKGRYDKGSHSFKLLAMLEPANVQTASPWAKRLIDTLKKQMK